MHRLGYCEALPIYPSTSSIHTTHTIHVKEESIERTDENSTHYSNSNSICKEEIEALSEMAHQINSKLNQPDVNSNVTMVNGQPMARIGVAHQQSNESVDLDNLFAFLSEVTPVNSNGGTNSNSSTVSNNNSSSIMDELEETMDNLVQDLDIELENVLQQEIEGLTLDTPAKAPAKMGVPTLPEPKTRPPPPPVKNCTMGLSPSDSAVETVPFTKPPVVPVAHKVLQQQQQQQPPPQPHHHQNHQPNHVANHVPNHHHKQHAKHEEPIYEAVIPRHELPVVPELPEPPLVHEHKLR